MAYSRTFLLLSLLFAVILVISSDVSARELAEKGQTEGNVQVESTETDHDHGHGYNGGDHGGWKGCKWGKCCKYPHCHSANEVQKDQAAEIDANTNAGLP